MSNSFTEITTQSWFGRIATSIKTVGLGLILVVAAFPLLFWNEGRAVNTARTLDEGARIVVTADAGHVDPANNGVLVHISGVATTSQVLSAPMFGVSAQAIQLRRQVEMYQWRETSRSETRDKLGGGSETIVTYTYDRVWSEPLIDSTQFNRPSEHVNPSTKPYDSTTQVADDVRVEAYRLPSSMVEKIDSFTRLDVDEAALQRLSLDMQSRLKVHDGMYYVGANPASPEIGDARIIFDVVEPTMVSVVARQTGDTFEPYRTGTGGTINMLQVGSFSAQGMFEQAMAENMVLTWVLRAIGVFLMVFGLFLVFQPLAVIASVVPLFGTMMRFGLGVFALVVGLAMSLFTMSIGWVFYRPLIGMPLLLASVGAVIALRMLSKRKARGARSTAAPA